MNNDRSTVEGQLMNTNIIYCGECSEVMKEHILDDSIDLTITSPPYDSLRDYQGYVFDFEAIAQELWRVTKQGGVVVWVVGDATIDGSETLTSFKQALYFRELGFNVHDTMIYQRAAQFPGNGNRYYQEFEYMFILSKNRPKTINLIKDRKNIHAGLKMTGTDRNRDGTLRPASGSLAGRRCKEYGTRYNIWQYATGTGGSGDKFAYKHPAPFPEALARDHIISWSNPSDIVLDPMCGSGTTLKMAKEQDRQYIGIDISQEYCDLSQRRIDGARIPLPGIFDVPTNHSQHNDWE